MTIATSIVCPTSGLRPPVHVDVVDLTRTIHTQDNTPVEVTRFIFDGSRHLFTYRVPID